MVATDLGEGIRDGVVIKLRVEGIIILNWVGRVLKWFSKE